VYPTTQNSDTWPKGPPYGAKILKGVKNCYARLQGGFTDLDEIGYDGGGFESGRS